MSSRTLVTSKCRRIAAAVAYSRPSQRQAQGHIGVDGIHTTVLERICPYFVCQANTSTFLTKVEHEAATFFRNESQGGSQAVPRSHSGESPARLRLGIQNACARGAARHPRISPLLMDN